MAMPAGLSRRRRAGVVVPAARGSLQRQAATVETEIHVLTEERVIEQIIFCNRTDGIVNIRLWLVAVDVSVADKAAAMRDRQLPANSTLMMLEHDFSMRTGESSHPYAS